MKDELQMLLRSKGAAEIVTNYGLPEALFSPESVPGLNKLQRKRLESIGTVANSLTIRPEFDPVISCSQDVFLRFKIRYGAHSREHFVVLTLNSRNQITSETVVAIGSVNAVHVHPSEILRPAVIGGCPSVIVIHNHPSGDPSPSPEDRALTERIANAANLMGVRLLDHIILVASSYYSFSDSGEL